MESTTINAAAQGQPLTSQAANARIQPVPPELRYLQRALLQAVNASEQFEQLLCQLGRLAAESLPTATIQYFHRAEGDSLAVRWQLLPDRKSLSSIAQQQLLQAASKASRQGSLHVDRFGSSDDYVVVSAPVFFTSQSPEALVVVLPDTTPTAERSMLVQLIASHVTLWHIVQESNVAAFRSQLANTLVNMVSKLSDCAGLGEASSVLVNELKEVLECDSVVVGMRRDRTGPCRLLAISGTQHFDRHSELVRAFEAAMYESILRGTLAIWPPSETIDRHKALTQQTLASLTGKQLVISGPLGVEAGEAVGSWVVLGDDQLRSRQAAIHFLRESQEPLGACLRLLQRTERGPVADFWRRLAETLRSWEPKLAVAVICALTALLLVPAPFKVRCDCQIQPVIRRYVAAPYDGKLEKVLVATGHLVSKGDVVARMDGRDIRWELAGLIAERGRVSKQRDVALASHETVTAQLAELEMERLDLKIQMLEHRGENLEIRSPIDGIVISGDLEKAEGAPLSVGQTLFEIGPLDEMAVELAVPEDHISFVRPGLRASIRLDAYPRRRWETLVAKVHPRSEERNDRNIFLAEANLDNSDDLFRPGMNGEAKITVGYRPLVWNLFHKPWSVLVNALGG
jgi:hypothetical protein